MTTKVIANHNMSSNNMYGLVDTISFQWAQLQLSTLYKPVVFRVFIWF